MEHKYGRFLNEIAANRNESLLRLTFKEMEESPNLISMAGGLPNAGTFPLKEATFTLKDGRRITIDEDLMEEALQYGNSDGYGPLQEQIRSLTQRLHAPPCLSDTKMFLTVGSQCALSLAIESMISQGDYVIIEEPCYAGALAIFDPYNPRYLTVEADINGMKPECLRSVLSQWDPRKMREAKHGVPKIIYTNPNGCNPSGGNATTERKKEIYKIAREFNLIILEDDPYYFIQFQEQKNFAPSYLSMDVDSRVIRVDSFSKTLSAGLRVGYITGPTFLVEKFNCHQQTTVSHPAMISQIIISEILKTMGEDGFIEHAKKVMEFYRNQRDAMVAAARKHLSGLCEWETPTGGMFLWMKVLKISDTLAFAKKLNAIKHVLLIPGTGFLPGKDRKSPYLRISYSLIPKEKMDEGFRRIAELLKDELQ